MMFIATLVLATSVGAFIGFCLYILWRETTPKKESYLWNITTSCVRHVVNLEKKIFKKVTSFVIVCIVSLGKNIKKIFFFFFPSAKKAFEKKHLLTGLHHGATSYFLDAVSADKKQEKEKKSRTRKKI